MSVFLVSRATKEKLEQELQKMKTVNRKEIARALEEARAQADWIASTGKNLTTIYATHGHGDHFFGASILLERFPKARFVARPVRLK